jgi:hypothetical protein
LPTSSLRPGQGPHSGDDTYDLTGHALRQLAGHRGARPGDDLTAIISLFLSPGCPNLTSQAWERV